MFDDQKFNFQQESFCIKLLFCNHYFSPLTPYIRKGKDPDQDPHW
jgi:hypothetical protein